MKKTLIIVVAMLFVATTAFGASVVGSKHDLRQSNGGPGVGLVEVCVACHTPHQDAAANKQYPLWNHSVTGASFGVYSSVTLNASPTAMNYTPPGQPGQSVSMLCMGCHDGTVAVLAMYNPPNSGFTGYVAAGNVTAAGLITGTPDIGTDLSDDHPVNFAYDTALATADGGLVDPASSLEIQGWLVGSTVQCSSCHDVHDNTNTPFLRKSNIGSALCVTCHNK